MITKEIKNMKQMMKENGAMVGTTSIHHLSFRFLIQKAKGFLLQNLISMHINFIKKG